MEVNFNASKFKVIGIDKNVGQNTWIGVAISETLPILANNYASNLKNSNGVIQYYLPESPYYVLQFYFNLIVGFGLGGTPASPKYLARQWTQNIKDIFVGGIQSSLTSQGKGYCFYMLPRTGNWKYDNTVIYSQLNTTGPQGNPSDFILNVNEYLKNITDKTKIPDGYFSGENYKWIEQFTSDGGTVSNSIINFGEYSSINSKTATTAPGATFFGDSGMNGPGSSSGSYNIDENVGVTSASCKLFIPTPKNFEVGDVTKVSFGSCSPCCPVIYNLNNNVGIMVTVGVTNIGG